MSTQNAEQQQQQSENMFSTLMNALVLVTVIIVVISPLIKKLKENFKQNNTERRSSFSSSTPNRHTSSSAQGFYNSQNSNSSSGQQSQNNQTNSTNAGSQSTFSRSNNIQQWNDRNERFKQILEQEDNPINSVEEYNQQIKKFIGQKISFNVKLLLADLKQKNIEPNCQTFEYLMQIILDIKYIEGALDLFVQFQSSFSNLETITPNIISLFLRVIQHGLNNQITPENGNLMVKQLNSIVDKYNIKLTEGSSIAMIDIALRVNKLEKAMFILEELENDETWKAKEDYIQKTCELYQQVLKNLKGITYSENDGIIDKLFKMLKYLDEKKEEVDIYPDENMINFLIDLCFQINQPKLALEGYSYFEKFNLSPSNVTYCFLIKGYGQLKQYYYAMTIYQQMKNNKIQLNEVTLGCLIDTCVKCNQLQKAEEILEQEKDIKPNTIIYTTLLKGYTKQENMKKALEIFEIMKTDKDFEPNIVSYNSLMECAVQCKDIQQTRKIFKEIMEQTDEKKKADLITYSTYIKGLFKSGDIEEALEIFENLRKIKEYKIDEIFYNSILDGLFKARAYEKTQLLYQKMRQDNINPSNVTYSILIKLNNALDKIDEALKILQEMKKMNVKPGLIVYTCLIQACIKHKRIHELLPLYEDMKKQNVRGDAVFYNTLVSGLMFNFCINDALKMTIDTLERKIILNQEVYQNLLTKVVKNYEKRKAHENQNEGEQEEVRSSRSYSGSIKFNSHFQSQNNIQSISAIGFPEDELTFQEMEKYLQKILLLLKKYQVEIDIDLYKQVINHVFVQNTDEKKEYLSYVNSKGFNNSNRQNWEQRRPTVGGTSYQKYNTPYYKGSGNTPSNSSIQNKNKSNSFFQNKRKTTDITFTSSQLENKDSNYNTQNKNTQRTNGGYNNTTSNNPSHSYNNSGDEFQTRSYANSFSTNKANQATQNSYTPKRFFNRNKQDGNSASDSKSQLDQSQDSSDKKNIKGKSIQNGSDLNLSANSDHDERQTQNEKTLEEFERDSDNSFDSKEDRKQNNQDQKKNYNKKANYQQSKFSQNRKTFN